jgi:hypothetical protein
VAIPTVLEPSNYFSILDTPIAETAQVDS